MPKLSESALKSKIAELQKNLAELNKRKKPALEKILALMKENNLTVADLQAVASKSGSKEKGKPKAAKPAAGARAKVEAKYRDAATGATWSGRGKTPRWLVDAEAAGQSRDSFKIAATPAA